MVNADDSGATSQLNDASGVVLGNLLQARDIHLHRTPEAYIQPPTPQQLPPDIAHFTGRHAELTQLDSLMREVQIVGPRGSIILPLIVGEAGVGKTALVVRWGYSVAKKFPDGQLYVNLRGYDPVSSPLDPVEVLGQFLRSLGVPGSQVPSGVDERASLYRTILAGRRSLIILDNAKSPEQVRALLPGASASLIVVTSRTQLSGLVARESATRIRLQLLSESEAVKLIGEIVGPGRATVEPQGVANLARLCARLPLALRVAGERAARHPGASMAELAEELRAQGYSELLAGTDDEATSLRSVFSWSYQDLPHGCARVFRLLALHGGTSISVPAAAALTGLADTDIKPMLEQLAAVHLVIEVRHRRYRYHDLLRAYALALSQKEDSRFEAHEAVRRSLIWYLYTADAANRLLSPHRRHAALPPLPSGVDPLSFSNNVEALEWCEAERLNLVAVTQQAFEHELYDLAWLIPSALFSFFYLRWHWTDWIRTYEVGYKAALIAESREGRSLMVNRLGVAYKELRRYPEAVKCFTEALVIRQEDGDRQGEATALNNLGLVNNQTGEVDTAIEYFRRALDLLGPHGDAWSRAWTLHNLGEAHYSAKSYDEAIECQVSALRISEGISDELAQGLACYALGMNYHAVTRYADALNFHERALMLSQSIGHRWIEARALHNLARTHGELRRKDLALASFRRSLSISEAINDRWGMAWTLEELSLLVAGMAHPPRGEITRYKARAYQLYSLLGDELGKARTQAR